MDSIRFCEYRVVSHNFQRRTQKPKAAPHKRCAELPLFIMDNPFALCTRKRNALIHWQRSHRQPHFLVLQVFELIREKTPLIEIVRNLHRRTGIGSDGAGVSLVVVTLKKGIDAGSDLIVVVCEPIASKDRKRIKGQSFWIIPFIGNRQGQLQVLSDRE